MSIWLDPVRRGLDDAVTPVRFFFRDDDVGWGDDRLFRMLDAFDAVSVPIDLAVIPAELSETLARRLALRLAVSEGRLRVHQHGYRHANHETQGRKCEFGPGRAAADQAEDLRAGRQRLLDTFDDRCDPIFTPPWNRCTQVTADLLAAGGYRALSRTVGASQLRLEGLSEIPVSVDWCRWQRSPDGRIGLGREIATCAARGVPVGIMLHHAAMPSGDRMALMELLRLLSEHPNASCIAMASLIAASDHARIGEIVAARLRRPTA